MITALTWADRLRRELESQFGNDVNGLCFSLSTINND